MEKPQTVLTPNVTVFVHPIDPVTHPSYGGGWRWAVHVGGRRPNNLDLCVNAGKCDTETEARFEAEKVGAAATKALRILGIPATYKQVRLDWDPIPAEADNKPLRTWSDHPWLFHIQD